MTNDQTIVRSVLWGCFGLGILACGDWKRFDAKHVDSFAAAEVQRIYALNHAGDVRIELGTGDTVTIEQRMRASGYGLSEDDAERAFIQGRVTGRMSADGTLVFASTTQDTALDRSDWLIRAPSPVSAECSSASGNVTALFMGSARLDAPLGSVEASHLSGNVSGTAGDGLRLTAIAGNVAMQSQGDALLDDVRGAVDLSISRGAADVRVTPPFGATVRIFAAEGIVLRLPASFAARYQVEVTGGTIEYSGIDLRNITVEEGGRKLSGETGGGQGQVLLKTAGGGIEIQGN